MFQCRKCKSTDIICGIVDINAKSGNDFYLNRNFGRIRITMQICWCSECGEEHSSSTLNLSKQTLPTEQINLTEGALEKMYEYPPANHETEVQMSRRMGRNSIILELINKINLI